MTQAEFEDTLRAGDQVRVRWRRASGRGVVLKVNQISFNVQLVDKIGDSPAGDTIRVARVCSGRWSVSNCVRPPEE